MGPSPSADLVGSILGVEEDNKTSLRRVMRQTTADRSSHESQSKENPMGKEPTMQIVWRNVLIFIYLHAAALYGFYLCFTAAKASTLVWCKRNNW